jgi:hypothetical protein
MIPALSKAQQATGSWFGRADVEMAGIHNNYLTELVLKQKGTRVDGIFGYYFRDKYQSFFVHGRYNPKTREVTILNIPVIYYMSNSTVNSIDCNTNFRGTLINSRVGSSLKGYFYHDERYKYMCPDLKVSYSLDRSSEEPSDSLMKAASAGTRIWKPQADDFVVDVAPPKVDSSLAVVKEPVAVVKEVKTDSIQKVDTVKSVAVQEAVAPVIISLRIDSLKEKKEETKKIAESFAKRKAVLNRELELESDSVRLSFYDNGEIDGDSISVFVNGQPVLTHQELQAKAFNLYLHLDSTREVNEISMFAENLGRLPPNTALMVVTDGMHRYEVFMSSSLTENATIRLKRKR